jgi:hypothetical protein
VTLAPWEYLFLSFNQANFPDLFDYTWIAAAVLLAATVVLYVIRTRQVKRHQPYLDVYEWILWTGVILYSLVLVYAVFHFDFIIVIATIPTGLAVLVWARFVRFPPLLAAYDAQLAKQRYMSRFRYSHPEATIRQTKKGTGKSAAKSSGKRRRR